MGLKAIVVFMFAIPASILLAQEIEQIEEPGIGFFGDGNSSWLEVEPTDDGSRLEVFLNPGGPNAPDFSVTWSAEQWTKIRFDEVTVEGRPATTVLFDPFSTDGGLGGISSGKEVYLQPQSRDYDLFVYTSFGNCFEPDLTNTCTGRLLFEYSITPVEPPLPGDLNHDDRVNFADFLRLSTRFNPQWTGAYWKDGDLNLDRRVNFADFLILSSNFGAVQEARLTAVPEPASCLLVSFALLGFSAIRRRR